MFFNGCGFFIALAFGLAEFTFFPVSGADSNTITNNLTSSHVELWREEFTNNHTLEVVSNMGISKNNVAGGSLGEKILSFYKFVFQWETNMEDEIDLRLYYYFYDTNKSITFDDALRDGNVLLIYISIPVIDDENVQNNTAFEVIERSTKSLDRREDFLYLLNVAAYEYFKSLTFNSPGTLSTADLMYLPDTMYTGVDVLKMRKESQNYIKKQQCQQAFFKNFTNMGMGMFTPEIVSMMGKDENFNITTG